MATATRGRTGDPQVVIPSSATDDRSPGGVDLRHRADDPATHDATDDNGGAVTPTTSAPAPTSSTDSSGSGSSGGSGSDDTSGGGGHGSDG